MTTLDDETGLAFTDAHRDAETVRQVTLDLLASLPQRPERLRISAAGVAVEIDWRPAIPAAVPHTLAAPVAAPAPGATVTTTAVSLDVHSSPETSPENLVHCTSPTVGTFYSAAEPGAAPFVAEGDMVRAGQQIGIVEAMKLMLPIKAETAGQVAQILVKDGQSVEFGESLIALRPDEG